jgi:hypothetical protein
MSVEAIMLTGLAHYKKRIKTQINFVKGEGKNPCRQTL